MAQNVQISFDSVLSVLKTVLDQLKSGEVHQSQDDENFKLKDFWQRFESCMKNVSVQTTKLSLAFSQPPYPTAEESKPLLTNMEASLLTLLSIYYSLPIYMGKHLHKAVTQSVINVVEALQTFLQSLTGRNNSNSCSSKQHLQSTGTVWEICDHVVHLPKDNVEAVSMNMKEALELISDAADELEEAHKNENVDEMDDSVEDHLSNNMMHVDLNTHESAVWSESDNLIILGCLGIVKTAKAAVKRLLKVISTSNSCDSRENIESLDGFMENVASLSPAVDDLVTFVYPPLKVDAVQLSCAKIAGIIRNILDVARASHFTVEGDSTWLDFLLKAVDHNLAKVTQISDG